MKPIYKQIEFEDDIVIVCDEKGNVLYRGIEDYEPFKNENWKYDALNNVYTFRGMTKKCLNVEHL